MTSARSHCIPTFSDGINITCSWSQFMLSCQLLLTRFTHLQITPPATPSHQFPAYTRTSFLILSINSSCFLILSSLNNLRRSKNCKKGLSQHTTLVPGWHLRHQASPSPTLEDHGKSASFCVQVHAGCLPNSSPFSLSPV